MNNLSSLPQARQMHGRLLSWLIDDAYPVWATAGFDPVHNTFNERLTPTARCPMSRGGRGCRPGRSMPIRGRGKSGLARRCTHAGGGGLEFFIRHYLRADGLFHTLVAPDGKVRDDRAVLYDQAFALLAPGQCPGGPRGGATNHRPRRAAAQARSWHSCTAPAAGLTPAIPERRRCCQIRICICSRRRSPGRPFPPIRAGARWQMRSAASP